MLTCRFTSILMASLLKIKRIPARVRSGFAPYFKVQGLPDSTSDDHWINQYWQASESRWVTIDVDGSLENYIKFNLYDIPQGKFDFSADAWLKVRHGEEKPNHFYNAGGWFGLVAIAWELFYDFHCLMNSEIIYFHHPEIALLNNFSKNTKAQLKEIDALAELMLNPDKNFNQLQKLWTTKKEFRLLKGGLL
ncbi:MAG: transglutaminase domain-containing protein [Patescibacteria group bacterium]|nr:transglutaminase domain-containing protein [Patescibacteria group bacterium]